MQEVILKPNKYPKGKYLRICLVMVEWDKQRRAFAAMVTFHQTRDRVDNRPLGTIIYANNHETLCRLLQEYSFLYPPQEELVVRLPEQESEEKQWSCCRD